MRRKITIEFIRAEVEKEGYRLVTKIYKNSKQKLELICPRGHTYFVSWNHWDSHNSRCDRCYIEDTKPSIEFIRSDFEKYEFTLLSDVYINNRTKLKYRCPNGYEHQITWGHWNTSKARCPCKKCNPTGYNLKYTLEQAVQEYKKIGYILLETEYINCRINMKCICDKGHIVYMSLYAIMHGHECLVCEIANRSGSNNPNWKGGISGEPYCPIWKDKEYAEAIKQRDGYKCMNPYCNSKDPKDLVRHHINYNIQDCRLKNIITTCRGCNSSANG
ncbi:hypothetical protein KAW18_17560, partial [candidate division WOR-3 bacterium]|nr:hypothetical protein [candidate division WOR-3 bacterium]